MAEHKGPRTDFDAPHEGPGVRDGDRQRLHDQAFGESGEGLHEREVRQRYGVRFGDDEDRLLAAISDALTDHPELDASGLEVEINDGLVTLSGSVPSDGMKTLAEALVQAVSGVRRVENALEIVDTRH